MNANINLEGFQPKDGDSKEVVLAKAKALKMLTQDNEDMGWVDRILDYGPLGLGFVVLSAGIGTAAIIAAMSASTVAKYLNCSPV